MSVVAKCVFALLAALAVGCTSTGDDLYDKLPDAYPIDAIVIGDADTTDAHILDAGAADGPVAPDASPAGDAGAVADATPTSD